MIANDLSDRADVEQVLERYRAGFADADPDRLAGLWDSAAPRLLYIAQELAAPLAAWPAIREYYRRETARLTEVRAMTISDTRIEILGDVGVAYCTAHFEGAVDGVLRSADGRATFVLRRTDDDWRVIHYHESALPGT